MAIELTPAKLACLKDAAESINPIYRNWVLNDYKRWVETYDNGDAIIVCHPEQIQPALGFIAEADPATVLALVEEIETLRAGLKASCPHWQQDGDGINEWRRCCTNSSYTIPEGGESSEFCPDCGGKVEVLDYDPNIESEAGQ